MSAPPPPQLRPQIPRVPTTSSRQVRAATHPVTANTPTSAPCAPECDASSLPPVLVGTLLRHRRTLAGLSMQTAADIVETSAGRISDLERARLPLPASTARILLTAYGTPTCETEQAHTLLTRPCDEPQLAAGRLRRVCSTKAATRLSRCRGASNVVRSWTYP
ncbi:helix-turn-helix transcriptional regulator [Streptomyces sp. NPDC047987]|uniref:helix-turn-helix domain-containing protein n=1 Tax=unclassified Streptomyces TaxID=2593676 RepID=UPI003413B481